MMEFQYIEFTQPIGSFILTVMPAEYLIENSYSNTRTINNKDGIQRRINKERIHDISLFCEHPDATFPTPIILSAKCKDIDLGDKNIMRIKKNHSPFSIIDGQHRLEGIRLSGLSHKFNMVVLLAFDLEKSQEAYIFSTINANQKPVSKSLVYDLFGFSKDRNPETVAHAIVKQLNENRDSLLHNKVKMLGVREEGQDKNAFITQAALIRNILPYISKNPERERTKVSDSLHQPILREYYIKEEDSVLYKIFQNYFNAVERIKKEGPNEVEKIFSSVYGYTSLIYLFEEIYVYLFKEGDLQEDRFYEILKGILKKINVDFTFTNGGSGDGKAKNMYHEMKSIFLSLKDKKIDFRDEN